MCKIMTLDLKRDREHNKVTQYIKSYRKKPEKALPILDKIQAKILRKF